MKPGRESTAFPNGGVHACVPQVWGDAYSPSFDLHRRGRIGCHVTTTFPRRSQDGSVSYLPVGHHPKEPSRSPYTCNLISAHIPSLSKVPYLPPCLAPWDWMSCHPICNVSRTDDSCRQLACAQWQENHVLSKEKNEKEIPNQKIDGFNPALHVWNPEGSWVERRSISSHAQGPLGKTAQRNRGNRGVEGQVAKRSSRGQSMCKTFCPKSRPDQIFYQGGRETQEGRGRDYRKGWSEHLRRNPSFGGQNSSVAAAKRVDRHIHAALRLPAIARLPDPITEGFVHPHEDKNCLLCQESSQVRL